MAALHKRHIRPGLFAMRESNFGKRGSDLRIELMHARHSVLGVGFQSARQAVALRCLRNCQTENWMPQHLQKRGASNDSRGVCTLFLGRGILLTLLQKVLQQRQSFLLHHARTEFEFLCAGWKEGEKQEELRRFQRAAREVEDFQGQTRNVLRHGAQDQPRHAERIFAVRHLGNSLRYRISRFEEDRQGSTQPCVRVCSSSRHGPLREEQLRFQPQILSHAWRLPTNFDRVKLVNPTEKRMTSPAC
mmetsp:Transcript_29492/g.57878  ORF Transcript_29492/g.57878 Transcript_29492/m.57878 type:complete len:246 (+) Transcript_29492:283-1020(+)